MISDISVCPYFVVSFSSRKFMLCHTYGYGYQNNFVVHFIEIFLVLLHCSNNHGTFSGVILFIK